MTTQDTSNAASPSVEPNSRPVALSPAEAAFDALKQDPSFSGYPSPVIEVLGEYLEALAMELHLDFASQVTLKGLMDAKIKALEFCLSSGFLERITETTLKNTPEMGDEMLADMLRGSMNLIPELIEQLKGIAADLPSLLDGMGVTEEEVMLSDKVGLNQATRELFQAGTLTLGELFVLQPAVIIKSTD